MSTKRTRSGDLKSSTPVNSQSAAAAESSSSKVVADVVGAHHKLLEHFVGKFDAHVVFYDFGGPDPVKAPASAVGATFFDGSFAELNYDQNVPGHGAFRGRATFSFDVVRETFQSVWLDTMSTGQFIEEGKVSTTEKGEQRVELQSICSRPDFRTGKTKTTRSEYVFREKEIAYKSWYSLDGDVEKPSMDILYKKV